ncbi:hypothetical protein EJ06DRAFT_107861 [Trichodelitschia bisporula]|uniref:Uncharacterized protein n=1 Tax=Trichodelitschia bisporula TaxID=703511 RepID=A0A6G1HRC8_9PEZI|nr:hypothetical protein EJ06DRAFT_107861 [Trichodelitschia bisporula]
MDISEKRLSIPGQVRALWDLCLSPCCSSHPLHASSYIKHTAKRSRLVSVKSIANGYFIRRTTRGCREPCRSTCFLTSDVGRLSLASDFFSHHLARPVTPARPLDALGSGAGHLFHLIMQVWAASRAKGACGGFNGSDNLYPTSSLCSGQTDILGWSRSSLPIFSRKVPNHGLLALLLTIRT